MNYLQVSILIHVTGGAVLAPVWYVNTDRLWNLDLSVKELRGRDYSKANSTLKNHGSQGAVR